jgi:hypothetical protein
VGDFLPTSITRGEKTFIGASIGGGSGAVPQREFFWENFLAKYCNFIVNLNHSSLGCRYDGRSYVMVFFTRRKPSFMYEGIVLQI